MSEHILFFGKGGVGKTTLVSNLSAALTEAGFRVLQVGCGPRGDSCASLHAGRTLPSVVSVLRQTGRVDPADVVRYGFKGVALVETGGGAGEPRRSAVEGIMGIFEAMEREGIVESVAPDFVFYDISGESSFAACHELLAARQPVRLYLVTTADFLSISTANAVFGMLEADGGRNRIPFGGLIPNGIGSSFEDSLVSDFALKTTSRVLGHVPRSLVVRQCELYGKTVIEASPHSNHSYFYRRIANQIADASGLDLERTPPRAMEPDAMRHWAHGWAERIFALENGLVTDGAAI